MDQFAEKVKKALSDYNMTAMGDAVVIALSGGADSVSLLYALNSLSDELGITVSACHVNHGLRGEEADSDMHFCERLCERLGVELVVLKTDVRGVQRKHESIEEAARRVRYEFFAEVSKGKLLATAHNSNDSAETVLLNMMRGTGLKGLCGIPPVRGNIIRPLIYCTRQDVEDYCAENSLAYVTDKTNLCDDYTRNKVRHIILPEIMKINSGFLETASRMENTLRADT
ncbi:MAG: tRNA lysidine(34) synthetase TilS, partial [Oscillospiraceae bacterium]